MMNEIMLTAEEEKTYDAFYARRKLEALGELATSRDELHFAQDLLGAVINDGLTPDSDGGVSWFRKDGLDWTDPAAVEAMQQWLGQSRPGTNRSVSSSPREGGATDMLLGIGILCAIIIGGWWYFFGFGRQTEDASAIQGTPTALVDHADDATPTPLPTLEAELLADIVDASGVKTNLVVPRTLELGGVSFVVQPVKIKSGDWALPDDERAVSWVYGTVVNYVMGLEATAENKSLLANLQSGAEILLRMSTGPAYRFVYADAVRVAPQASEIFRQTHPGLTLVLMGAEEESSRIVLRAVYLPDSELGMQLHPEKPTTALKQVVTLNEQLRLIPQAAYPQRDPNVPPGYLTLSVDLVWQNIGQQPLDPSIFHHYLDANGLRFAPLASAANQPSQAEPIPVGQTISSTLRYAIPEPVLRSGTIWTFALDAASLQTARVTIPPYEASLHPQLSLIDAVYEGTTILATVEVSTPASETTIDATDLTVRGATLDETNRHFPWRIPANDKARFTLHLQPTAETIQVQLGESGFEIMINP